MNYRETNDECPGCGATAKDRKSNKPDAPQGLETCPYTGPLERPVSRPEDERAE